MADEIGSVDCPDCQFQLLQQQNYNLAHSQQQSQNSTTANVEIAPTRINSSTTNDLPVFPKLPSSIFPHDGVIGDPSTSTQQQCQLTSRPNAPPPLTFSYDSSTTPFSKSSTHPPSSGGNLTSSTNQPQSLQHSDINFTATNSPAIESCDYNGYCSTCAVLELPTNEKFYRSSNSRPHVFPSIFYSQGPSSVIPCFSPIPDCPPWSNEFNHYAYSSSYSQPPPPPSVPSSVEYYASSAIVSHSNISQSYENAPSGSTSVFQSSFSNNLSQTMYTPYSQPQPQSTSSNSTPITTSANNGINNSIHISTSTLNLNKTIENSVKQSSMDEKSVKSDQKNLVQVQEVSVSNSGSSSGSSSCDNDSYDSDDSSINSEDRELISVVEEDEDEEIGECGSTKAGRPGGKCCICQNPIEITDCSSPQLAKILENIEEDITAEDLDITVSSGDIEIGGMEDEVRDFPKKRHASSTHGVLSINRLAILLGISSKSLLDVENPTTEADVAFLCFRCGKLASLADSLERQLSSAIQTLHQQIMSCQITGEILPLDVNSLQKHNLSLALNELNNPSQRHRNRIPCGSSDVNQIKEKFVIPYSPTNREISTQTDFEITEHFQTELILPLSKVDRATSPRNLEVTETEINSGWKSHPEPFNPAVGNLDKNIEDDLHLGSLSEGCDAILSDDLPVEKSNDSNDASNVSKSEIISTTSEKIQIPEILEIIPTESIALKSTDNFATLDISTKLHEKRKPTFTCQYCQRLFTTKSNMKSHMEICKFRISQDLLSTGNDELSMKCFKCGIGFRSLIRRQKHLQRGCKPIIFECDQCQQRFPKASELKAHLKVHLGEKSFSCDTCGAAFCTKGNQMAHMRTHLNSKKFHCNQCDKGFNRRFALEMHLNRHNGVKPFSCNMCSKSFPDPSNLKNHKKKFHKEIHI